MTPHEALLILLTEAQNHEYENIYASYEQVNGYGSFCLLKDLNWNLFAGDSEYDYSIYLLTKEKRRDQITIHHQSYSIVKNTWTNRIYINLVLHESSQSS